MTRANYDEKRVSDEIQYFFFLMPNGYFGNQSLRSAVNNGLKKPEHVNSKWRTSVMYFTFVGWYTTQTFRASIDTIINYGVILN